MGWCHHCRKKPSHENRHEKLVDHGKEESRNQYDQAEKCRVVNNFLFHLLECSQIVTITIYNITVYEEILLHQIETDRLVVFVIISRLDKFTIHHCAIYFTDNRPLFYRRVFHNRKSLFFYSVEKTYFFVSSEIFVKPL